MKIRFGFVSNSSSTSFVISMTQMPTELKKKIMDLTTRNNDTSRCTGKITDLYGWAKEILSWDNDNKDAHKVKSYADNPNVIMIRESDEEMGGSFGDHGFSAKDIDPYVLYEFEYH